MKVTYYSAPNPWDLTERISRATIEDKNINLVIKTLAITTKFDGKDTSYFAIVVWEEKD